MASFERHENRSTQRQTGRAWRRDDLRSGYTTSACAAAAAAAAARALAGGRPVQTITIDLPGEQGVCFAVCRCEIAADAVTCGVIKDAGDDPDITHGAEIRATVRWSTKQGVQLFGGKGVGTVTKPGLPLPIGEPAINPGPRRIIERAVRAELADILDNTGVSVTISVPTGRALAAKTLNPRLGIVGGISILGTSGIVRPYSNEAYRASIHVELKVAAANGLRSTVLTTGRRSEEYAMRALPDLPEMAFVQVGDHMDHALRQARRLGFTHITIAGMLGKLSKIAQGRMQTHVSQGEVDMAFLASLAERLGAPAAVVAQVGNANTARHVQNLLGDAGLAGLEQKVATLAAHKTCDLLGPGITVQVLLYDIGGELLATTYIASEERSE